MRVLCHLQRDSNLWLLIHDIKANEQYQRTARELPMAYVDRKSTSCFEKVGTFYFLNNSSNNEPIETVFGAQNFEEI